MYRVATDTRSGEITDADAPPERTTTVVVVDDHPMIVQMTVAIVEAMPGFSAVGWAPTAAEGLAAVLAHRPDVVVIDYLLPDGQGSDLARGILRHRPDTKVVMLTGASTSRALVDALDAGCHAFLHKGRAPADLVRVLTSVAAGGVEFPDELLAALPRLDDLVVHYQPIVDLQSESVVGAEALVRWHHPERGLLAPATFIPQAEETGLVVPLGWRVLAEACRQTAEWHHELPDATALSLSVNVSAQQLARPDFVERVADALATGGLAADRLVLELTETGMMDRETATTAAQLEGVRSLGVELRLDDFGTGYSSLLKLRRYPIGALKVDRSFVGGMLAHAEDAEIVLASIRLAQSLGIRTVAEGVEEEAEADKLRSFGCELAQGYLWSPPLSADAFAAWYRHRMASHPGVPPPPPQPGAAPRGRGSGWVTIRYEHCGWCHLRGAYLVPGRPVLRCKYCQASAAVPARQRGDVERELTSHTRNLIGLRTTRRMPASPCRECGG